MAYALQNRWPHALPDGASELDQAVCAARLIGAEPELVLFGGGNTSVKVHENGRPVMYVKGSGADLAYVTAQDYTPLALEPVRSLLAAHLPDNRAMYAALAPHVLHSGAPRPSIETLMHAGMDMPHVIHTHAAAVLALANTRDPDLHLRAAFGAAVPIAPYRHSGLELARACVETWRRAAPDVSAPRVMVLAHHGALACGASAREAHDAMLELANRAEEYLESMGVPHLDARSGDAAGATPTSLDELVVIAHLRQRACRIASRKLVATRRRGGFIAAFARRADLAELTTCGPSTPGHAIWTKRIPLIGRDMDAFAARYRTYLAGETSVDCAPRVVLDAQLGLVAFGVTARHAGTAATVFIHDAAIMARAAALGGYATIGADLMRAAEVEYAGFEARVAAEFPRAGEVHVVDRPADRQDAVTRLLDAGAAVAGIEDAPARGRMIDHPAYLGVNAAADAQLTRSAIIEAFGGVDHVAADRYWQDLLRPFLELEDA